MTFFRDICQARRLYLRSTIVCVLLARVCLTARNTLLLYTLKPQKGRFRSAAANRDSVPCRFSRTRKPCCFVVCVPISVLKVNSSGQHGMLYLHKPYSCGMQYKFSVFFIDLICPTLCVVTTALLLLLMTS